MFKRQSENVHSIYVLLFLHIAFFFLQIQDLQRFVSLFAFDRGRFLGGEVWRLFTYQFLQGEAFFSPAIGLFITLLILYWMGGAVEEEWGTRDFVAFVLLSFVGSAAVAFLFNFPLIGSFFVWYSLLFAFSTMYPEQTILLFFILPVKVKWLGYFFLAVLLFNSLLLKADQIAALGGAALSYGYFLWRFPRFRPAMRRRRFHPAASSARSGFTPAAPAPTASQNAGADANLARFAKMKETLEHGDAAEVDALMETIRPDVVPGVNICPPADYKPENEDRYCIRCEGFAECSVRYLQLNREQGDEPKAAQS